MRHNAFMASHDKSTFVGRGGVKLAHALAEFSLDVTGLRCADFGCNVGGFTDCLLQAGAAHVVAVDTGYGALAYTLRIDDRVTVLERTNALHAPPPSELVDLVVVDLAWTPQRRAVPAALKWLKPGESSRIITLIKPHYEAEGVGKKDRLVDGVLPEQDAETVLSLVLDDMPAHGADVIACTRSPILGGAGKKRKSGNIEWLAMLRPTA